MVNNNVNVYDVVNDRAMAVLCDLTKQNKVFTAYDVTKQLRKENPTIDVIHSEVRDIILEEWKNTFCDEYESTLMELNNGQHSYVYHPETVSPETHPMVKSKPVPTKNDVDEFDLTDKNRLNISKELLTQLGLVSGKIGQIVTMNGVMSVRSSLPDTMLPARVLTVNTDGRLRIGEKMLTEAFGHLNKKYNVSVSSDKTAINIRPH